MSESYLRVANEKLLSCRQNQYSEQSFRNAIAVTISALDVVAGSWEEIAKRWPERGFTRELFNQWSHGESLPEARLRQEIVIRIQGRIETMLAGRSSASQSFTLPRLAASWEKSGTAQSISTFEATPVTVAGEKLTSIVKRPASIPKLPVVEAVREAPEKFSLPKSANDVAKEMEARYLNAKVLHQSLCTWQNDHSTMRQCALTFLSNFGEAELSKLVKGAEVPYEKIRAWLTSDPNGSTFVHSFRREFIERLTIYVALWLVDEGKLNMSRWPSVVETARRTLSESEMSEFLVKSKATQADLSLWSKFFGKKETVMTQEKTPDAQVIYRLSRHLKGILTERLNAPWGAYAGKPVLPRE